MGKAAENRFEYEIEAHFQNIPIEQSVTDTLLISHVHTFLLHSGSYLRFSTQN